MKRKMVEKTVNRVFLKNVRVVSITTKRTGSNITVEVPARWTINKKVRKMWRGEREAFKILKQKVDPNAKYIWFHAASLGEYHRTKVG